jgi:hypothetical protein
LVLRKTSQPITYNRFPIDGKIIFPPLSLAAQELIVAGGAENLMSLGFARNDNNV